MRLAISICALFFMHDRGKSREIMRIIIFILLATALSGCLSVRQQDLDAWVDVPVELLDTHSWFITVPMYKTITESGIEIRNYVNGKDISGCFGSGSGYASGNQVNVNTFTTCSSGRVVCNSIFYIKDGRVIEYAPTGRCYTDEFLQPQQERYLKLNSR